jgi:hypothetical protein
MTAALNFLDEKSICPIFQKYFFENFPQWNRQLNVDAMKKLYNLACAITLKKDSEQAWQVLESNPFLLMYFGYQIDHIHQMGLKKRRPVGFLISGTLFLLGGVWSLYVHKMDPTVMHLLSLAMGGIGAMIKVHCAKFLRRRRESQLIDGLSQKTNNLGLKEDLPDEKAPNVQTTNRVSLTPESTNVAKNEGDDKRRSDQGSQEKDYDAIPVAPAVQPQE